MDSSRSGPGRGAEEHQLRDWQLVALLLLFLGLLALYAWVLSPMGPGALREKVQIVFAILALYGFGLTFLLQSAALKRFGGMVEEMTSPNLLKFLRGNSWFAAFMFGIMVVAMGPQKPRRSTGSLVWDLGRCVLESLLLLLFGVVLIAYTAFHFIVIMPIAYVAYAVVSLPAWKIENASKDFALQIGKEEVTVKGVFSDAAVEAKSLAVAVPAVVMVATVQIVAVLA